MRLLPFEILLISSLLGACFAERLFDWKQYDDKFDTDFDSDWFWMGSNLRSISKQRKYIVNICTNFPLSPWSTEITPILPPILGRPKFKITEHPDGYSIQFGMAGYYMRGRYTASDNSIDFNIMDHKGSIKYVINEWRPGMIKRTFFINDSNFCDNFSCI